MKLKDIDNFHKWRLIYINYFASIKISLRTNHILKLVIQNNVYSETMLVRWIKLCKCIQKNFKLVAIYDQGPFSTRRKNIHVLQNTKQCANGFNVAKHAWTLDHLRRVKRVQIFVHPNICAKHQIECCFLTA